MSVTGSAIATCCLECSCVYHCVLPAKLIAAGRQIVCASVRQSEEKPSALETSSVPRQVWVTEIEIVWESGHAMRCVSASGLENGTRRAYWMGRCKPFK